MDEEIYTTVGLLFVIYIGYGRTTQGDLILKYTGAFGRYQLWLCFLVFLTKFAIAVHQMAIIFLAPRVVYTCGNNTEKLNPCPCDSPVYNKTVFTRTMVMQFNLICGRKWLASLSQTIFQAGTLAGSVGFGMASDRFGRRKPLIAACMMQIVFGIAAAYTTSYEMFATFRFIVGLSVGGTMVIGFVIIMEFIGPQYREVLSALYQVPFNMGHMLLPLAGYLFRDYSDFQLAISAPELIFIIYFYFLPETPRWLIAMKRTDEAISILSHVAKVNNLPRESLKADILIYQAEVERHKLRKGTIADLFRTPNLRRNNLAMAFNWLMCSYCFYGLSQYIGQLGGNIFLNVLCSASVTLMGTLTSIPLMKLMGRKTILLLCHVICSACLVLLAFTPESIFSVVCASVGTVTSFIVFVVVYLYTGELFPTVVRNAAIGFSSMMARIGSMIAPFVCDFKDIEAWMAPMAFAVVPFLAIFVTFLLPETKGCPLTTTIEEGEEAGRRQKASKKPK